VWENYPLSGELLMPGKIHEYLRPQGMNRREGLRVTCSPYSSCETGEALKGAESRKTNRRWLTLFTHRMKNQLQESIAGIKQALFPMTTGDLILALSLATLVNFVKFFNLSQSLHMQNKNSNYLSHMVVRRNK
jgi:hypothetical protein